MDFCFAVQALLGNTLMERGGGSGKVKKKKKRNECKE